MRNRTAIRTLASLAIATGALAVPTAASAAAGGRAQIQAASRGAAPASKVAATPEGAPIDFTVGLELKDPTGARAFEEAVTNPRSASYRHYLTPAQFESRFSPTKASVDTVTSWLRAEGLDVEGVTADRMTISVSGTAATVAHAFGTTLGQYHRLGRTVRLAAAPLTVPASISSLISGVTGVEQNVASRDATTGVNSTRTARRLSKPRKKKEEPIEQPFGFRNAPPCSKVANEVKDTVDPPFEGYPQLHYAMCGYTPPQLQQAYNLTAPIAAGDDGKGQTVAVIDAYASPTLLADAQQYAELNQPGQPLESSQYSQKISPTFNEVELCEAPEWFGEQTLDVEAVHATAPGANILYVGAKNCLGSLFTSVQEVVDGHLAQVITDSWGDDGGDLLDSTGTRKAFDNVLLMAANTGIGVQFSAGDEGDEFANLGMTVADYPPSSPLAISVGGTSLLLNKKGKRLEYGWSTSKSLLCSQLVVELTEGECTLGSYAPPSPGAFLYGGGGGTSYQYGEPSYQDGVVPTVLTERNSKITGVRNRVEPDISMDADPTTGMLVGETQQFPEGTHYDQYRIGGTSLSSPLFAGVMADADQAAGTPLGFVNPLIYSLAREKASGAFYDVKPHAPKALVRNDFLDEIDAEEGILTSVRTLDYEGLEEFCSGTENCTVQNVAISPGKHYDSMTGIGSPGANLLQALAAPTP
jgi:subtilase family serine protease